MAVLSVEKRQRYLEKLVLSWCGSLDPGWPSLMLGGVGEELQHFGLGISCL